MGLHATVKFKESKPLKAFIAGEEAKIEAGIIRLGRLVLQRMHNEIKSRRKRKGFSNNLISAIRMDIRKSNRQIGAYIGDIDVLNKEAEYWYVVNYGKKFTGGIFIPPATVGSFEGSPPMAGGINNQRFGHHSPGYYMKPKTFRPLHYIERTQSWLINFWSDYWNKIL